LDDTILIVGIVHSNDNGRAVGVCCPRWR
jgi:hypothetical protein